MSKEQTVNAITRLLQAREKSISILPWDSAYNALLDYVEGNITPHYLVLIGRDAHRVVVPNILHSLPAFENQFFWSTDGDPHDRFYLGFYLLYTV